MKKILLGLMIIIGISSTTSAFSFSGCEERGFTVTAYYSPESGQIFYYKPSFQEEILLNGEGYTGASGKPVFNGMLAGPASYPFGSIIYLPGLGVGEIADRGGAIVLSGEKGNQYDRIDIWMGRGEEGLIRALTFGKKNMTGYICSTGILTSLPKYSFSRENIPVLKYFFDITLRIQELQPKRQDIRVRTLQKYLVKLGYLNKKYRHGIYDTHTKKALCTYQVHKKIVGKKHPDCGIFGKMTRLVMKQEVQNKGLLPDDLYTSGTLTDILDLAKYYNGNPKKVLTLTSSEIVNHISGTDNGISGTINHETKSSKTFYFYRAYTKGQQSLEIKILQNFLVSEGLYSGVIDGIYHQATINAVYEFQKKYGLIMDTDPLMLRGFLGPKTRSKINELSTKTIEG